jgi:hypothetical protein
MYHSYLVINTGGNPDRPRPGRRWIGNIYNVHQRLCMGFPNERQIENDPDFLLPFNKDGFTDLSPKTSNPDKSIQGFKRPEFLFRIENIIADNQTKSLICVRSKNIPNWEYAFRNAEILLDNRFPIFRPKEFNPTFEVGDQFRFKIDISLSKKSSKYRYEPRNEDEKKTQGKRIALTWESDTDRDEVIRRWFEKKNKSSREKKIVDR